jgi:hypothetical protein
MRAAAIVVQRSRLGAHRRCPQVPAKFVGADTNARGGYAAEPFSAKFSAPNTCAPGSSAGTPPETPRCPLSGRVGLWRYVGP